MVENGQLMLINMDALLVGLMIRTWTWISMNITTYISEVHVHPLYSLVF